MGEARWLRHGRRLCCKGKGLVRYWKGPVSFDFTPAFSRVFWEIPVHTGKSLSSSASLCIGIDAKNASKPNVRRALSDFFSSKDIVIAQTEEIL